MNIIRNFVANNKFTTENLPSFEARLFFEGAKMRSDLERFVILLFLSVAIATYGVIGDSAATVIGAMIIAPLMRPIMATAAAVVMGDMKRAGFSFLIVLASVAGVIGVAWLLTEISIITTISIENSSQFSNRISPTLVDFYAAIWSGAAAAFAMSRDDIADALPGAAIAIALVPPLCVVGIALAEGLWTSAAGAFILFLTNFLSILLAGGGVLALLGLSAVAVKRLALNARRRAFAVIAIGIVMVTIPLGRTTLQVYQQKLIKREATNLAQEWVQGSDYGVNRVDVTENQVTLSIYGSGEQPQLSEFWEKLGASIDQPVEINLVVVPSEQKSYTAGKE
jgi:uncharacterized hydrophobic protein (TIGR00271 family)